MYKDRKISWSRRQNHGQEGLGGVLRFSWARLFTDIRAHPEQGELTPNHAKKIGERTSPSVRYYALSFQNFHS